MNILEWLLLPQEMKGNKVAKMVETDEVTGQPIRERPVLRDWRLERLRRKPSRRQPRFIH